MDLRRHVIENEAAITAKLQAKADRAPYVPETRQKELDRALSVGLSRADMPLSVSEAFRAKHDHVRLDLAAINRELELAYDQRAISRDDLAWAQKRVEALVKHIQASGGRVAVIEDTGPAPALKPTWAAGEAPAVGKKREVRKLAAEAAAALRALTQDTAKDALRDAARLARAVLGVGEKSPATAKAYERTYQRIEAAGQTPAAYCAGSTRGTYYAAAAAWQYGAAKALLDARGTLFDKTATPKEIQAAWREVRRLVLKLDQVQGESFEPGRRRAGKRHSTSLATRSAKKVEAADWRHALIEKTAADKRLPVLVLAASGCRPSELVKGVTVAVDQDGTLTIGIHGSKCRKVAGKQIGVEFREIRRDAAEVAADPVLSALAEAAKSAPGSTITVQSAHRQELHRAIKHAAKEAGLSPSISAYTFRHQFATDRKTEMSRTAKERDLEALQVSDEITARRTPAQAKELAYELGHASEETQGAYGTTQAGGGPGPSARAGAGPRG